MQITLMILLTVTAASFLYFYKQRRDLRHPGFWFNVIWFIAGILLALNYNDYYPVSELTVGICLIGIVSFNIPLYLSKRAPKFNTEKQDIDEINDSVIKKIIIVEWVLFALCIPIIIRAISFINSSGIAMMRNIFSDSVTYGYMNALERLIYIHYIVFPLIKVTSAFHLIFLARGRCKFYTLIPAVLNQVAIFAISVGRNDIFIFIIWGIFAFMLRPHYAKRVTERSERQSNKNAKRIRLIILIPIASLVVISIIRHRIGKGSYVTMFFQIISTYIAGGFQLFDLALANRATWGLDHFTYGAATLKGALDLLFSVLSTLTGGRIGTPEWFANANIQTVAAQFHYVSASKRMNAYMTMFYYFMRDFGIAGVVGISMLVGRIIYKIYYRLVSKPNLYNSVTYLIMLNVLFFTTIWWEGINSALFMSMIWNLIICRFITGKWGSGRFKIRRIR